MESVVASLSEELRILREAFDNLSAGQPEIVQTLGMLRDQDQQVSEQVAKLTEATANADVDMRSVKAAVASPTPK